MSSNYRKPIFSNDDAEVVILDATAGEIDTSHRPASGASLKMALQRLEKEAELRKLMEQVEKENGKTIPTDNDSNGSNPT